MKSFQAAKELALQAGLLLRFEAQLPGFLRRRISVEESKREIQAQVERRPETFLNTVREAIYARPECVYSRMLKWAGVEYGDLESLVSKDGIEGALDRLREAGVFVSTDEIKGLRPLARGGLKIEVRSEDFDNPLVERAYRGSSSGSSGHGRASHVSLAALEQNAMLKRLYQHATGMDRMPGLLWRAVPPGVSGMANFLEYHLMGNPFQAWYTPTHSGNWRSWLVTQLSLSMCVISGQETAWPQYLPLTDAWKISNLLAERKRRGEPAMRVDTVASGAARICAAALERNLDISGTCFRVSGEPFSASKEELFKRAGCLAWCTWAMSEAGTLGGGCANRQHRDEVHIALNKVALTTGEAENGGARAALPDDDSPVHSKAHAELRYRRSRAYDAGGMRMRVGASRTADAHPQHSKRQEVHRRRDDFPGRGLDQGG